MGGPGEGIGMAGGSHDDGIVEEMDGLYPDGMDVDEDAVVSSPHFVTTAVSNGFASALIPVRSGGRRRSSVSPPDTIGTLGSTLSRYESALHHAISYGQTLSNEYKDDARLEVRQIFKRTFAIVAWEDPLTAGGVVTEVVGHDAKVVLANELNQAILKSQGRPSHPVLETLYRQTAVCTAQLGLMGVGGATFADMQQRFFDSHTAPI